MRRPSTRVVTFLTGILAILAISVLAFYFSMNPPMSDLSQMIRFLSITAVISVVVSLVAYRLGWMYQSPSIRWTIFGGYAIASLLTFVNVWVTARLMFASLHDLQLATVLLIFAGGIAIVLGLLFATALTDRIGWLDEAARRIALGDLDTRLDDPGNDEIAALAATFNSMVDQLQAARQKQLELDQLRRDLIAWVSHDLQTPLASMRAIIEALADGVVDDPTTIQRYLHTAQREIGALSLLIDDLFQIAQIDAGGLKLDLEMNSISDLISDTLESFSELANRKGIYLEGMAEQSVDPVWMDAPQIGRVINNLVRNALSHTPQGGKVTICAQKKESGVLVEVVDNGEGIRDEDLPHVFERFYRGEKSRGRVTGQAGLGLAIAQGIVEAHGGSIHVSSNPGNGARFWFLLPAHSL
jgi:signal transduction histidine kinase